MPRTRKVSPAILAKTMDIINNRIDVHPSKRSYHQDRLNRYCLDGWRSTAAAGEVKINGIKYHLLCGKDIGHMGSHEDIEGGIFWKRNGKSKKA